MEKSHEQKFREAYLRYKQYRDRLTELIGFPSTEMWFNDSLTKWDDLDQTVINHVVSRKGPLSISCLWHAKRGALNFCFTWHFDPHEAVFGVVTMLDHSGRTFEQFGLRELSEKQLLEISEKCKELV